MGRPAGPPSKSLTVRLPLEVYDRWVEAAEAKGKTVSAHVRDQLIAAKSSK